ncbi:MAG UNVERIFIED_CONTAM: hypothetical protein LVQ98_00200 [Rickettsiaceae bacterium]
MKGNTNAAFNVGADAAPVNITFTGKADQTLSLNGANTTIYANITKDAGAMALLHLLLLTAGWYHKTWYNRSAD